MASQSAAYWREAAGVRPERTGTLAPTSFRLRPADARQEAGSLAVDGPDDQGFLTP